MVQLCGKENWLPYVRFKDDVREVEKGYECGMNLDGFNDIKVGDQLGSLHGRKRKNANNKTEGYHG